MAQLSVGGYLFSRLQQLGIKSVFGVPGDYELVLLDMIDSAGLTWRGNPNELIAGYAADGYARANGVGAFVTTFGPGELSAYCCMAGQYAEYVPVVHIVGYPSTMAMNSKATMHHSLGDGNFGMYHQMVQHISVASAILTDPNTAASDIDRVLNAMMYYSRPVYIGVPVNIGLQGAPSSSLSTKLKCTLPANDPVKEKKAISEIINLLGSRKQPVVVIDGGAVRNNLVEAGETLIKKLNVPYFATPMSKGVSERIAGRFGGIYSGGASTAEVKQGVENADLVLFLGRYASDFNTGEFTDNIPQQNIIDFQRLTVKITGTEHTVSGKHLLKRLLTQLSEQGAIVSSRAVTWNPYPLDEIPEPQKLSQDFLWAQLGKYFKAGDFVIAETGTSSYGIPASNLMNVDGVRMYNQTVFGSIGYATGAALGTFISGQEDGSTTRNILITGEGSLQLTVQTFSDLLRHHLNATVFILNNDGYTVERLIHGREASYNKVPDWNYSKLCETFGPSFPSRYYQVRTGKELVKLLSDPKFNSNDCTQVVELFLGMLDAPKSVKLATEAVEEFNARK